LYFILLLVAFESLKYFWKEAWVRALFSDLCQLVHYDHLVLARVGSFTLKFEFLQAIIRKIAWCQICFRL